MKLRSFAVLLAVALSLVTSAFANPYSAIYVFGDSYCDTGNVFLASGGKFPPAPYYQGRFSNGPLWVEHLAGSFHLAVKPSLGGGTNFAFGGAQLLQDVVTSGGVIPSVPHQVELYLASTGGVADPNALYILEGGGNDILNATSGDPKVLGANIGSGLAALEIVLSQAGAKNFLIPNLFDVGLLPVGRANYAFDTTATQAANYELGTLLKIEQQAENARIFSPNVYALAHSMEEDSSTYYGFKDVVHPCINPSTGKLCADPDHTLFLDGEHVTEFGQTILTVASEAYVHP